MECLKAVAGIFPSDDAQTNTTFCAVDCCLYFWAKSEPSLVCESWEVINLIMADINQGSWGLVGCWTLYASSEAVHILLTCLGGLSLLLSTMDKGICNLQPEFLELFVLLHTNDFGIAAMQQPSIVDGCINHLPKEAQVPPVVGVRYKATMMSEGQLLPCGHCTLIQCLDREQQLFFSPLCRNAWLPWEGWLQHKS